MWTGDAVHDAVHHLARFDKEALRPCESRGFREERSLLERHTGALLGAALAHGGVSIMVTMPSEAADVCLLVCDLVSHGMNCMRLNCAHDTAKDWRIVEHLKRARRKVSLPCCVFIRTARGTR